MADRPVTAKIGLVGPAGSGKTSLFCALTGAEYARAVASTGKAIGGNVRVLDPRLVRVHEVEGTQKKLVTPILEIVDAPSVALEGPDRAGNSGRLAQVRECDGFLAVLRAYEGGDPAPQLEAIRNELVLADLDVMQKRIDRLQADTKKSLPNREELLRELEVLQPLCEAVLGGDVKAFGRLTAEDEKRLRGFQFYSKKPLVPLANVAETDLGKPSTLPSLPVKLEMELLAMEAGERAGFMKDYGLSELALEALPVRLFGQMGFHTFVTTGDKDVTGWSVRQGGSALEAAGRIHTDLQKGFISCEIVAFAEWSKWKNYHEARARGPRRVEGKAYVMQDFDFIEVKFNV
jgi:hypothetical protein